jgi:hypothetical protein
MSRRGSAGQFAAAIRYSLGLLRPTEPYVVEQEARIDEPDGRATQIRDFGYGKSPDGAVAGALKPAGDKCKASEQSTFAATP